MSLHPTNPRLDLKTLECSFNVQERYTIKPGYGDCLKEDEEEDAHPTGWVVVKQLEHIQATLKDNMNQETHMHTSKVKA